MCTESGVAGTDPHYRRAWGELKWRVWRFLVVWIGGFMVVGLLGRVIGGWVWVVFLFYALGVFMAAYDWGTFPCPRCGKQFFARPGCTNLFRRYCPHCRLQKWSDGQTDSRWEAPPDDPDWP